MWCVVWGVQYTKYNIPVEMVDTGQCTVSLVYCTGCIVVGGGTGRGGGGGGGG